MTNGLVLYNQWCNILKRYLENENVNISEIILEDIPMYYYEYFFIRTFQKKRYNIFMSKELKKNQKYGNFKHVLDNIVNKSKDCSNINTYLSRGIKNIKIPDKMLNDWGVLHLHLSNNLEHDGFVERTNELLFAYRDILDCDNNLYFLDIFEHGDWAKKRTIEILCNNWPKAIKKYRVENMKDIYPKIQTDEDIKSFREANMNIPIKVSGSYYIGIGGSVMMNGVNMHSMMFQIENLKFFRKKENEILFRHGLSPEQLKLVVHNRRLALDVEGNLRYIA